MFNFKPTKIALATSALAVALAGCSSNQSTQTSADEAGLLSMKNETQQENRGADKAAVYAATESDSANAETATATNQQAWSQNQSENPQSFGTDVEQMSPITQTVSFEFDSAELTPEAERNLRNALGDSQGAVAMEAEIVGYADAQGPEDYNMNLSERRAQSVREFISGLNTNISDWEVEGRGEQSPASSNDSEWGRAQNRRVSVTLKPVEQVSENTDY